MTKIAPSILSADFLNLADAAAVVNRHADLFHIDVMDGVFVPNLSFGFPVTDAIDRVAEKALDVHLMIVDPENYALKFAAYRSVEMVSFHLNACKDPKALLLALKQAGVKAGLAINPDFAVEELYPYLEYCDFVVIMSVFAGYGGQKFIEDTYQRLHTLKAEIEARGLDVEVEVDGGVKAGNARAIAQAGADILVAGSFVFNSEDPAAAIASIR